MSSKISLPLTSYLEGLYLRNFRGFKKSGKIPLAPLTYLVGPNSSGKSSLSSALLLLAQSGAWGIPLENDKPNWSGSLVDLGSFDDVVYRHNKNLAIEVGYDLPAADRKFSKKINFRISSTKASPLGRINKISITDQYSGESIIFVFSVQQTTISHNDFSLSWQNPPHFYNYRGILSSVSEKFELYIKGLPAYPKGVKTALRRLLKDAMASRRNLMIAEAQRVVSGRTAPKRWYSVSEYESDTVKSSGYPSVFDGVDPSLIKSEDESLFPYYRRKSKPKTTLGEVFKKLDIANEIIDFELSDYHHGIKVKDSATAIESNLIDVGYGASQAIPVIQGCLSNARGLLFVEQPEIHLHPKAQGVIADLLCQTSSQRQVIVETHSVHMINRARILVAKGDMDPDHVVINYIKRTPEGSEIKTIPILRNGDFGAEWPSGFFDERFEDTMRLIHLKSNIKE